MLLRCAFQVAFCIAGFCTPLVAAPPDPAEVEAGVKAYFSAMTKRDFQALADCLATNFATGKSPTPAAFVKEMEEYAAKFETIRYKTEIASIRSVGLLVVARVRVKETLRAKGQTKDFANNGLMAFTMSREEGRWKMQNFQPAWTELLAQLNRAKSKEDRKQIFLAESDEFLMKEFLEPIGKAIEKNYATGALKQYESLLLTAEEAAESVRDEALRRKCTRACQASRAKLLTAVAKYDMALAIQKTLLEGTVKSEEPALYINIVRDIAMLHYSRGDMQSAYKCVGEIEEYLVTLENKNDANAIYFKFYMTADLRITLGEIYGKVGDNAAALKNLTMAKEHAVKTRNIAAQRRARFGLALLDQSQSRPSEAIGAYRALLKELELLLEYRLKCHIFGNLGYCYMWIGNIPESEKAFKEALRQAELSKDPQDQADCLKGLSELSKFLGNDADYTRYRNRAIDIYFALGHKIGIAYTLQEFGILYYRTGRKADGYKCIRDAAFLLKESGEAHKYAAASELLSALYRESGELEKADAAYQEAIEVYQSVNDTYSETRLRLAKASQFRKLQDIVDFQTVAKKVPGLNSPALSLYHHQIAAHLCHLLRDWPGVIENYRAAAVITEHLLSVVDDPVLKASFQQRNSTHIYAIAAEAEMAMGHLAAAFRITEEGKARSLCEMLDRSQLPIQKGMTEAERNEDARLRQVVIVATKNAEWARQHERDEKKRGQITEQQKQAEFALEDFHKKLYAAHPDLSFRLGKTPPASLEEIQRVLFTNEPDAIFASYIVGFDRVLITVVSRGEKADGPANVRIVTVPIEPGDLQAAVNQLREGCKPGTGSPIADNLHKWLIEPIGKDLEGKKHLVIFPAGPLLGCPFQAIRKEGSPYLIEQVAVSYAPSVSTLVELRKASEKRRAGPKNSVDALAIGGALFSKEWKPLPSSGPEAEAVAQLIGGNSKTLLAAQATRSEILKQAGSASVLHFATHGMPNGERPLFSALAVTPADAENDDGRLYAHDIMNLELNADLTVFSACETSLGRDYSGEGTIGLAWAFFVAGTTAVTVSQWSVADESTCELMKAFYAKMQADPHGDRAAALQAAQVEMLKNRKTRHPFYWAPFVLIGDWRK